MIKGQGRKVTKSYTEEVTRAKYTIQQPPTKLTSPAGNREFASFTVCPRTSKY